MWELLKANHVDESLCLANQKQGAVADHISYTLVEQVHSFAAPHTSLSKLTTYVGAKPFS